MNKVVNWFTILLILIFDPMAVALIIVFNRITKKPDDDTEPTKLQNKICNVEPVIETVTATGDIGRHIIGGE
jgi:hypothetical protein